MLTTGLLVVILICASLGFLNLDHNMWIQYISFILSLLIFAQWNTSAPDYKAIRMPLVFNASQTNPKQYGRVAGTMMLNLAITYVIPSWMNLKSKDVNAQNAIWLSFAFACSINIITGICLALGYENIPATGILTVISKSGVPKALSKATVYAFAFVMLIPSIPVMIIISKGNLTQNKVLSPRTATFFSLIIPILAVIPLQNGFGLLTFQTWTSLLLISPTNFIIPVIIYFKCLYFRRIYNQDRILSRKQIDLLHFRSGTIDSFLNNRRRVAPQLRSIIENPENINPAYGISISNESGDIVKTRDFTNDLIPSEPLNADEQIMNYFTDNDFSERETISTAAHNNSTSLSEKPIDEPTAVAPAWFLSEF